MKNRQKQRSTARCDICKEKHGADNERMRQSNKAMIVPSSIQPSLNTQTHMHEQFSGEPLVPMFCECGNGKDIDMNMFWVRSEGKHRFQNIRCTSCKKNTYQN